jgi:hypothetical protein
MDQAMGDLQAQLEEVKRLWEEERIARQRAESELDVLRGIQSNRANGGHGFSRSRSPDGDGVAKRRNDGHVEGGDGGEGRDEGEGRSGKRQRRDEKRDA